MGKKEEDRVTIWDRVDSTRLLLDDVESLINDRCYFRTALLSAFDAIVAKRKGKKLDWAWRQVLRLAKSVDMGICVCCHGKMEIPKPSKCLHHVCDLDYTDEDSPLCAECKEKLDS